MEFDQLKLGRLLITALALMIASSCGSTQLPQVSVSTIAAQPSDVPANLQQCVVPSGSVDHWIESFKAVSATEYAEFKSGWDRAKAAGALDGWLTAYTDSAADCTIAFYTPSEATTSFPMVVSLVMRLKDEATAARLYDTGTLPFMPDPAAMKSQGAATGTTTGLGPNSVVLTSTREFLAYWQKKAFAAELSAVNLDPTTSKQVAAKMNNRIG
jgi:hypothetical protein